MKHDYITVHVRSTAYSDRHLTELGWRPIFTDNQEGELFRVYRRPAFQPLLGAFCNLVPCEFDRLETREDSVFEFIFGPDRLYVYTLRPFTWDYQRGVGVWALTLKESNIPLEDPQQVGSTVLYAAQAKKRAQNFTRALQDIVKVENFT